MEGTRRTGTTAPEYFDTRSDEYDEHARKGMPRRDEMLSQLVDRLPDGASEILELGCGTGALTRELVERYPDAHIVATDGASQMLERAANRISGTRGASVELRIESFERLEVEPGRYDLITSCMALHHVADKRPFYAALRRSLSPGGYLIFADELKASLEHVEELHWNTWLRFASQPGHMTASEIEECLQHIEEHDHYETLWDQLQMLDTAGFRGVDCAWRYLNYGVFTARA